MRARIRVLLADVRYYQGVGLTEALAECEAAAAVLDAEGDMAGLAEALGSAGRMLFLLGDGLGGRGALERAIACARQSGYHRAQMRASNWLAISYYTLPIPVDVAVARPKNSLMTLAAIPGQKQTYSGRSARCTPISAVPPTPARPSTAARACSPASA